MLTIPMGLGLLFIGKVVGEGKDTHTESTLTRLSPNTTKAGPLLSTMNDSIPEIINHSASAVHVDTILKTVGIPVRHFPPVRLADKTTLRPLTLPLPDNGRS
jgi:hypothetical protein